MFLIVLFWAVLTDGLVQAMGIGGWAIASAILLGVAYASLD